MPEEDTRSPEEQAANVAKLEAETRKLIAEAEEAAAKARVAVLDADEKERKRRELEASDVFHRVYRFDTSVSESSVNNAIAKTSEWHRLDPGCEIEIIFDSPGGLIHDGMKLFDHLRHLSGQGHKITTGATGMAASMAGILIQAGDHRWMSRQAWYMIHRAAFGAIGKTYEIEDEVKLVKRIEKRIIDIFADRSDLTPAKIKRNWDRKDWWIDAEEAYELRLVDEIRATA